jgi:hypothetical protein
VRPSPPRGRLRRAAGVARAGRRAEDRIGAEGRIGAAGGPPLAIQQGGGRSTSTGCGVGSRTVNRPRSSCSHLLALLRLPKLTSAIASYADACVKCSAEEGNTACCAIGSSRYDYAACSAPPLLPRSRRLNALRDCTSVRTPERVRAVPAGIRSVRNTAGCGAGKKLGFGKLALRTPLQNIKCKYGTASL